MKIKAQFNSRELEILTALFAHHALKIYNIKQDLSIN